MAAMLGMSACGDGSAAPEGGATSPASASAATSVTPGSGTPSTISRSSTTPGGGAVAPRSQPTQPDVPVTPKLKPKPKPEPSSSDDGVVGETPPEVWANQEAMSPYLDELSRLAGDDGGDENTVAGWCGVEIDPEANRLILRWKGTPPREVQRVLARAKAKGIKAELVTSDYDLRSLQPHFTALGDLMDELDIVMLDVNNECSAITVGLSERNAAAEARIRAAVPAWVPLDFTVEEPITTD